MFFEFAFSHKRAGMASPEIESTLHAEVGPKTTEMAAPNTEHYEQSPYILCFVATEREDTGDCGRGSVSPHFAAHHRADTHIAIQTFRRLSFQNGDFSRALDHPTRRIENWHDRSS